MDTIALFLFAAHVGGARRVGGSACGDVREEFGDLVGGDEGGVEEGGEGGAGVDDGSICIFDGGLEKGAEGGKKVLEGVRVAV